MKARKMTGRSADFGFQLQPKGPALAGYQLEPWSEKLLLRCTFCGSYWCRRCGINAYKQLLGREAIPKMHSQWIGPNIIGMQRPSERTLREEGGLQSMLRLNVGAIINLQEPGEHPWCGDGLQPSGFSYEPHTFEEKGIAFFNFGWEDMMRPSLEMAMEIAQAMDYAIRISKKKVAIHCHAGYGRTGLAVACYFLYARVFKTADEAIAFCREQRPGTVQTKNQVAFVHRFEQHLGSMRKTAAGSVREQNSKGQPTGDSIRSRRRLPGPLELQRADTQISDDAAVNAMAALVSAQQQFLHGREQRRLAFVPRIVLETCERLEDALAASTGRVPELCWLLSCIIGPANLRGVGTNVQVQSRMDSVRAALDRGEWEAFPGGDEPEILGRLLREWLETLPSPLVQPGALNRCFDSVRGQPDGQDDAAATLEEEFPASRTEPRSRSSPGSDQYQQSTTPKGGQQSHAESRPTSTPTKQTTVVQTIYAKVAAAATAVGTAEVVKPDPHNLDDSELWRAISNALPLHDNSMRTPSGVQKCAPVVPVLPRGDVIAHPGHNGNCAPQPSQKETLEEYSDARLPLAEGTAADTGMSTDASTDNRSIVHRHAFNQLAEAAGTEADSAFRANVTPRRNISGESMAYSVSELERSPLKNVSRLQNDLSVRLLNAPMKEQLRKAARQMHLKELQKYIVSTNSQSDGTQITGTEPGPSTSISALAAKVMWREFGPAVWLALDRRHPKACLEHLLSLTEGLFSGDDGESPRSGADLASQATGSIGRDEVKREYGNERKLAQAHIACIREVISLSDAGSSVTSTRVSLSADELWRAHGVFAWRRLAKSSGVLVSRSLAEIFSASAKQWQRRHAMGRDRATMFRSGRRLHGQSGAIDRHAQLRTVDPMHCMCLAVTLAASSSPQEWQHDTSVPDWYLMESASMLNGSIHPERILSSLIGHVVANGQMGEVEGFAIAAASAVTILWAQVQAGQAGHEVRDSAWFAMTVGLECRLDEYANSNEPARDGLATTALQMLRAARGIALSHLRRPAGESGRTQPLKELHPSNLGQFVEEHIAKQVHAPLAQEAPSQDPMSSLDLDHDASYGEMGLSQTFEEDDRTLVDLTGSRGVGAKLGLSKRMRALVANRCCPVYSWRSPDAALAGGGSKMSQEASLTTMSVLLRLSRAVTAACDATGSSRGGGLGLRSRDVMSLGRVAMARLALAACQSQVEGGGASILPMLGTLSPGAFSSTGSPGIVSQQQWPWGYVQPDKSLDLGSGSGIVVQPTSSQTVATVAQWEVLARHWRLPGSRNFSTAVRRPSLRRLFFDKSSSMGSLMNLRAPLSPIATLSPKGMHLLRTSSASTAGGSGAPRRGNGGSVHPTESFKSDVFNFEEAEAENQAREARVRLVLQIHFERLRTIFESQVIAPPGHTESNAGKVGALAQDLYPSMGLMLVALARASASNGDSPSDRARSGPDGVSTSNEPDRCLGNEASLDAICRNRGHLHGHPVVDWFVSTCSHQAKSQALRNVEGGSTTQSDQGALDLAVARALGESQLILRACGVWDSDDGPEGLPASGAGAGARTGAGAGAVDSSSGDAASLGTAANGSPEESLLIPSDARDAGTLTRNTGKWPDSSTGTTLLVGGASTVRHKRARRGHVHSKIGLTSAQLAGLRQ